MTPLQRAEADRREASATYQMYARYESLTRTERAEKAKALARSDATYQRVLKLRAAAGLDRWGFPLKQQGKG